MATVKVLVARVKSTQGSEQQNRATKTLKQAFDLLTQSFRGNLDWNVSEVNKEEEGPLPQGLGYNEDQDFIDADSPGAQQIAKNRNLYLEASYLERALVLWIVPQGEIANANAFSLLGGLLLRITHTPSEFETRRPRLPHIRTRDYAWTRPATCR